MLKSVLLITSLALSLTGCQAPFPKAPRHIQWGVQPDIDPPGFYGVDSETHERFYLPFLDLRMKGGQCLNNSDFKKGEAYVREVDKIAKERCK